MHDINGNSSITLYARGGHDKSWEIHPNNHLLYLANINQNNTLKLEFNISK